MIAREENTARILQRLLDGTVLALGAWTLYCYVLAIFGADFHRLSGLAWVPFVVAAWAFSRLPRQDSKPAVEPQQHSSALPTLVAGAGAAAGAVVIYIFLGHYGVFWVLAAALLLLLCRVPVGLIPRPPFPAVRERTGVVITLCLGALVLTLTAHRPDADDSFYLSLMVGATDHQERPILRYDDMYGEQDLPLIERAYRLKSYELLLATLSDGLGVPAKGLYYLIFPAFFAVLVVAAHWLTLREIGGSFAWLGAAVVVLVLIVWGDGHRTFGNFSFVRLFQGKAVLVSVLVPTAVLYASRFARNRSWLNWLLLAAVQVAALGMSPSAVVVAPMASAAYLLAAAPDSRGSKLVVEGLLASALVVVAGAFVISVMPTEGPAPISMAAVQNLVAQGEAGLDTVLGLPARKTFALLTLLLVPLLAPIGRRGRVLRRYALILVLLIMNPLLPGALGIISSRLSWRVFWAVPFPLLIGLLAQRMAAGTGPHRLIGTIGAVALATGFAFTPGAWTTSMENGTLFRKPGFKVDSRHAVARSIVERTSPTDLVLAPYDVALWLPTISRHPRLVGVRPNYYHSPAEIGWIDLEERKMLMQLVTYPWFPQNQVKSAAEVIERRGVTMVVVPTDLPQHANLTTELEYLHCQPISLNLEEQPNNGETSELEIWKCPGKGPCESNFPILAPRCAADSACPIEGDRKCSSAYLEDFAIEGESKMRCSWDAKTESCSCANPKNGRASAIQALMISSVS